MTRIGNDGGMRRGIIFAALVLWLGGSIANAADRYGEWYFEELNSGAPLLFNKDTRPGEDKVLIAKLGFTCDRRQKAGQIGATLIPFEGTYNNQQRDVVVLAEKSLHIITPSDLSQKWHNGFKYIFVNEHNLMDELVMYLKTNEANGTQSVHFLFSGDFNGKSGILNHVDISLSGFSDGYAALNTACKANP
jgi:hypothetical protein